MGTPIKKAIAVFGGAAAVVLAVGFGAAGVSQTGSAATTTTHPPASIAMPQPGTTVPGLHVATLAACIVGANC
jgi:hypothetical protein